ncbi:TetR/AcrR family transcriptional regulator C-terminal domain-containing protein [Nocardioides sp. Soil805]|uniref:TetR/AcrR family transcriptional regulator C-terminal domain-containing protein n=1 Tax=Nocardioides sp. Soil805 TaxID=1736416 RepID=UPI0007038E82|nr:TetR/AcrR family transcriptional regulator C-terminal domain-containing protein [Nocardioides sp. Soil805]KRF37660.1 AcrR family transcriptional regulator [Nocardioides sp. Soil805]
MPVRPSLTRDGIVDAAVAVADVGGLTAVSMRNVGRQVGAEAMSLYHHIAGKEELLDALADWAFARITLPGPDESWRDAMAVRAASARAVLLAHPWALGLLESRRHPGPALLHHHDAVIGCLRGAGFPVVLAAHAFSVLDAYVYGFVLTELNLPMGAGEDAEAFATGLGLAAEDYPHLVEMMTEQVVGGTYAYADEFDYGLDLVLDGLEERLARTVGRAGG